MAHRRRPAQSTPHHKNRSKIQLARQARPKAVDFFSESEGAQLGAQSIIVPPQNASDDESDGDDINKDSDSDEEDTDTPRVAQWIDDEDFELQARMDDTSDSERAVDGDHGANKAGPSTRRLRSLEHDLSALPLGALRSAQRCLSQAQALSDTESGSEAESRDDLGVFEDDDPSLLPTKGKRQEKPAHTSKSKNADPIKRPNKHAPIQVTSKRPVSRRRVVVDDKLPKPRDPRFMQAAGRYDLSRFKQQYEFLSGLRSDELVTLHEHVKRARKLLVNSPVHLRGEREEEVKQLEHATKRAESAVNLDNRQRAELKALQSVRQTEKEKRRHGKAEWWMKRSAKKELLAKARLDAIALVGGERAVKKAVEKKRKKIGQKEKKMRPLPRSKEMEWPGGRKRRLAGSSDSGRGMKRHKVI